MTSRIIVGITGASGAAYAIRLIETLLTQPLHLHLIASDMGMKVLRHELEIGHADLQAVVARLQEKGETQADVVVHDINNMFAPVASGSFHANAMVIVPCSMKTLSAIAGGYTSNLLERAADVTLKEKRPLVLVPRETPLNLIHLKNMVAAAEAGATILPASPGFYHHPESIGDMVAFVVDRVLDHLGIIGPRQTPEWET